jgi:hypothetical protein
MDYVPWCPDCGDALETRDIWCADKLYGQIIDHHEYYCIGCDKTFLLVEKESNNGGKHDTLQHNNKNRPNHL